jgi:hypothetical protein
MTTVLAPLSCHLTSARTRVLYNFYCALALTQDFNCDIDSSSQEFISFGFLIVGHNNLMSGCTSRSKLVRMPMTQLRQARHGKIPRAERTDLAGSPREGRGQRRMDQRAAGEETSPSRLGCGRQQDGEDRLGAARQEGRLSGSAAHCRISCGLRSKIRQFRKIKSVRKA